MKRNKLVVSLLFVGLLVVALAVLAFATPAPVQAVNYAQINSVAIVGHNVNINASGPCPALFPVTTTSTSTKIKITVATEPNPIAGICAPDAPLDNADLVVPIALQKNKAVYVNGVYYGVMMYKSALRK